MSKKLETFGNNKNGILHIIRRAEFWQSFAHIFKDGERVKITIEKVYSKRSSQQNRFFHGCVVPCVQDAVLSEWGESISLEQAKILIKEYCNYKEILNEKTGEYIKILLPTSSLKTIEFEELNIRVRKWLWDSFNYVLPEPGDQGEINF